VVRTGSLNKMDFVLKLLMDLTKNLIFPVQRHELQIG